MKWIEIGLWVTAGLSLLATWLNIQGQPICFHIWVVTNAIWTAVDAAAGLHSQATLQSAYLALAVYGAIRWTRWAPVVKRGTSDGKENST